MFRSEEKLGYIAKYRCLKWRNDFDEVTTIINKPQQACERNNELISINYCHPTWKEKIKLSTA